MIRNDNVPFVGGEFDLQMDDVIYAMTDGYQDQFGGSRGKKLKVKPMKRFLKSFSHQPMKKQGELLAEKFDRWKGNLEQIDDVCLIGIRV